MAACIARRTSSPPRTRRRRRSTRSTRARHESAFITSGRLPVAPEGRQPRPARQRRRASTSGRATCPTRQHPQVINPSSGYIVNWNNKPAKDFPASDSRSERAVAAAPEAADRRARAPAQADAGQRPGRGQRGRDRGRAHRRAVADAQGDARPRQGAERRAAKQVADLLQAWHDAGGSRRDADRDGKIDDPGVPILDAAWKGITDAGLCDRLGTSLCKQLEGRNLAASTRRPAASTAAGTSTCGRTCARCSARRWRAPTTCATAATAA